MTAELTRDRLIELLEELDQLLQQRGLRGEMYVVGGAAMALAYDSRRITADVDAVFVPKMELYRAAEEVAARHPELGLALDWLNDGVKGLLPPGVDEQASIAHDGPGLTVSVASPEHLLALKIAAARIARDRDDILLLCDLLGLGSINQALDLADRVLPGRISARSMFFVTELLQGRLPQSMSDPDASGPLPLSARQERDRTGRCSRPVRLNGRPCVLRPGHGGACRSR